MELLPSIQSFIDGQFQYPEDIEVNKRGSRWFVNLAEVGRRVTIIFDREGNWTESNYRMKEDELPVALSKTLRDNFSIVSIENIIMSKSPFTGNIYYMDVLSNLSKIVIEGDEGGWYIIKRVEDNNKVEQLPEH